MGAALSAAVLCIPSFASSWRQYRGLAARLAPRFRVIAADLYGHGEREPWNEAQPFTLADEAAPLEALLREIEAVRDETFRLLEGGAAEAAAEHFIDYWTGAGSWAATPAERRPKLIATVCTLRHGWQATFLDRWSVTALRELDIPCLLLTGTASTAAARRAVRLLGELLPRASVAELDGLPHMGPVTHPERVDPLIESFIKEESWVHSCHLRMA